MKRNGDYTNLDTDEAGNLVITLTEEGRAIEKEMLDGNWSNYTDLVYLIHDHLENGLDLVNPEDIGALTDSPILSDVLVQDDHGNVTACDYVWWYPDYQVLSPVEELYKNGKVVFTKNEDESA